MTQSGVSGGKGKGKEKATALDDAKLLYDAKLLLLNWYNRLAEYQAPNGPRIAQIRRFLLAAAESDPGIAGKLAFIDSRDQERGKLDLRLFGDRLNRGHALRRRLDDFIRESSAAPGPPTLAETLATEPPGRWLNGAHRDFLDELEQKHGSAADMRDPRLLRGFIGWIASAREPAKVQPGEAARVLPSDGGRLFLESRIALEEMERELASSRPAIQRGNPTPKLPQATATQRGHRVRFREPPAPPQVREIVADSVADPVGDVAFDELELAPGRSQEFSYAPLVEGNLVGPDRLSFEAKTDQVRSIDMHLTFRRSAGWSRIKFAGRPLGVVPRGASSVDFQLHCTFVTYRVTSVGGDRVDDGQRRFLRIKHANAPFIGLTEFRVVGGQCHHVHFSVRLAVPKNPDGTGMRQPVLYWRAQPLGRLGPVQARSVAGALTIDLASIEVDDKNTPIISDALGGVIKSDDNGAYILQVPGA